MINSVCGVLSTGKICADIAQRMEENGHECRIAYGRGSVPEKYKKYAFRIGTDFDVNLHAIYTRLTDKHGFSSRKYTEKFIRWAEEYNPDLLWIHNIHGYYINIELLFNWIKSKPDMKVKWTLHDCWAFTGHCTYFMVSKCEKWKIGCEKCTQNSDYPASITNRNCSWNYAKKEELFTGIQNMTLVAPSNWLANLVKESFLKEYPIEVNHNTINTEIFKPTESDFRTKYGLENKKIVLGVASTWSKRKGLNDFIKLSQMLDDNYVVVLVGVSKKQSKTIQKQTKSNFVKQSEMFGDEAKNRDIVLRTESGIAIKPNVVALYGAVTGQEYKITNTRSSVVCIPRTNSAKELAEIYTAADVFVNPTYEDNYPTVNLEAQACGTKVITYDTGGCIETLLNWEKAK